MSEGSESAGRIPTPLVVALSAVMVAVGVVALFGGGMLRDVEAWEPRVEADRRLPETAAESFLDAWRKREHDVCLALSTGELADQVQGRRADDKNLGPEERAVKEAVWDQMAASRLRLQIEESTDLPGGKIALRGRAVGEFLQQPYEREVLFVVLEGNDGHRVAEMHLGEILSEVPEFLGGGPL
ncbi:MAG: hypothetical protein AAGF12_14260 [Myxococcota bacterium]